MAITIDSNVNYNDFASLSRLRVEARDDSEAALQKVAKQFESIFVQMMIKSMRDASVPLQGDLFHSNESKAYTDMYDKQLGLELTKSNGIGLADVIVRQLSVQKDSVAAEKVDTASMMQATVLLAQQLNPASSVAEKSNTSSKDTSTAAITGDFDFSVKSIQKPMHWSNPEDFIRDSWPHAQRAGKELGVDPKVIIAQSALETGWGKKVHVNLHGENSYSLFGIKAGANWSGKTVQFNTLEFRSGSMNHERASFRAYNSLAESYQDYVKFLQANPRYEKVLNAETAQEYSVQLQKAGYATDPNYSMKIERIRQGELINKVVSELKISSKEPLV